MDFAKRKAELNGESLENARMLSRFAYNAIGMGARVHQEGSETIEVNPAYTSIQSLVNHSKAKGVSVRQR